MTSKQQLTQIESGTCSVAEAVSRLMRDMGYDSHIPEYKNEIPEIDLDGLARFDCDRGNFLFAVANECGRLHDSKVINSETTALVLLEVIGRLRDEHDFVRGWLDVLLCEGGMF